MTGKKKPLKRDEMVRVLRRDLRTCRKDLLATMNSLTATRNELARVKAIANHNGERGLQYAMELEAARNALSGASKATLDWLIEKNYVKPECVEEARVSIAGIPAKSEGT